MWLRRNVRPALALAACFLSGMTVAGCGFAPVYGERSESGSVKAALAGVRVDAPESRSGQLFRHRLLELLSGARVQPEKPVYALKVTLDKEVFPIHVLQNRKVTRFRMHVRSQYELIRLSDGAVLDSGELVNSGGYDRVESDYATYVSGRAVGERGMLSLADDYRQLLVNYFLTPEAARTAPRPAGVAASTDHPAPSTLRSLNAPRTASPPSGQPIPAAGMQEGVSVGAQVTEGGSLGFQGAPSVQEPPSTQEPEAPPSVYVPPRSELSQPEGAAFPKADAGPVADEASVEQRGDHSAVAGSSTIDAPAPPATFSADLIASPSPETQSPPPSSPEETVGDIGANLGPNDRAP